MRIKTKVLYESKYKDGEAFDKAIDRWESKGWILTEVVNSFTENLNAAIIYREVTPKRATPPDIKRGDEN